jgi:hypothetical protein
MIGESRGRVEELRDCRLDDIDCAAEGQRRQFEGMVGREKVDRRSHPPIRI